MILLQVVQDLRLLSRNTIKIDRFVNDPLRGPHILIQTLVHCFVWQCLSMRLWRLGCSQIVDTSQFPRISLYVFAIDKWKHFLCTSRSETSTRITKYKGLCMWTGQIGFLQAWFHGRGVDCCTCECDLGWLSDFEYKW